MRRSFFGIAACVLAVGGTLGGCLSGEKETPKQKALKAYTDCLCNAASKQDDGEDKAETVASKIAPMCSAEFRNVVQVNNDKNRKEFEAAMQPKQLDFAATMVRDRRKRPCSN